MKVSTSGKSARSRHLTTLWAKPPGLILLQPEEIGTTNPAARAARMSFAQESAP